MNTSFYVALAVLASVAVAEKPSRSKKEVGYTPYGANTDTNRYLGNAGYSYYNQQQSYSQPGYPYNQQYNQPYNQQYNQQYNQPYNQQYNHQQQLPYQRYNNNHYNNYNGLNNPYNSNPHYQQFGQQPYNTNQYNNQAYDGQHSSYTGYQNDYQNSYLPGYGGEQNGFGGYPNSVGYNQFGVRQAPAYPSPGFQPARPSAPHPFYHTQGTYYPSQTTEAYKPVVAVDPKKIYK